MRAVEAVAQVHTHLLPAEPMVGQAVSSNRASTNALNVLCLEATTHDWKNTDRFG